MISYRIQLLIVIAMGICIAAIGRLLSRRKIDYKIGIVWAFVFACIAVLALMPRALARIAAFLGIASPVNMLFFFSFIFCAGVLFSLSRRTSRLQDQVRCLAQEVAVLRQRLDGVGDGPVTART